MRLMLSWDELCDARDEKGRLGGGGRVSCLPSAPKVQAQHAKCSVRTIISLRVHTAP